MNQKMKALDLVDRHRYLRQGMIQQALRQRRRTSQHMLRTLAMDKLLYRFRLDSKEQYIYHADKTRSAKWAHWLAVNEFHFALLKRLQVRQRVLFYQLEYRYPFGQADGIYVVQTHLDGGILFFLEMDDGANQFDKVENYERYYLSRRWVQEPWADPMQKGVPVFPAVVCVTPRAKEIEKLAARAEKVSWQVYPDAEKAAKGVIR